MKKRGCTDLGAIQCFYKAVNMWAGYMDTDEFWSRLQERFVVRFRGLGEYIVIDRILNEAWTGDDDYTEARKGYRSYECGV